MNDNERIKIAVQKSGRLNEKSLALLYRCGLEFEWAKDRLVSRCQNFPLDLMLLRDDDIPNYVRDGVCDLGIVGLNVLEEKQLANSRDSATSQVTIEKRLGFGICRLGLAIPAESTYSGLGFFQGTRIATSYPAILGGFLRQKNIQADVVEISGSVEIAPALKIADAICDVISTGTTLRSNGLKEVASIFESESVLVRSGNSKSGSKDREVLRLLQRLDGVTKADQTKYIMMNAPKSALRTIQDLLPGMEEPTIMPIGLSADRVAIHAVSRENIFWETMEGLKSAGATSILVMPIEKIIF